ncbi:sodium- and chloride-dependent betaine transporter isoform X1 [Patella vulgata]|uniref:sodium- and chloride-dependent betaine transporter isoform X1 n=1 Tax=Patella vulgata TaxID=6465 RepID=UPI00217FF3F6|nr:sodium- and chloride-dependent betaine transporter isoform X1 [Patella vulgata]
MSDGIPQWNLFQFMFISVFTCYVSFMRLPTGGLEVISQFLLLIFVCVPALFIQLKLGGYLQKGIVGVFGLYFPIWKGVGLAALIELLIRISHFAPIVAQFGTYAFISISESPYVWGSCANLRNNRHCVDDKTANQYNQMTFESSRPEELFYKHEFLQMSSGIEDMNGFPQWEFTEIARKAEVSLMPVTLAIVWVLVFLLVGFGGRVCGWILFLLGPAALSCLLAVLGYGYAHLKIEPAVSFLKQRYLFNDDSGLLQSFMNGFQTLMCAMPIWTAIATTMGKLCGRGRTTRNISWLVVVAVFVVVSQIPPIAMAPYLGNMIFDKQAPGFGEAGGPSIILWQMPAAFTALNIPQPYSFLFLLSAFLFGLMFLCIGCLTIVDNIMDSLEEWVSRKSCSKIAVHLLMSFVVMCIAKGLGILQTTRAGLYYFGLIDQSITRLQFILIDLLAFGLVVVYLRQNFALAERIIMALWVFFAATTSSGVWFYVFHKTKDAPMKLMGESYIYNDSWKIVSWVIAAFPYIGVIIGVIHAVVVARGKITSCFCGITERVREQEHDANGYHHPPPPLPEPTAPPYTYMEQTYPMDDMMYKMDYDPPESEPLTSHGTRI